LVRLSHPAEADIQWWHILVDKGKRILLLWDNVFQEPNLKV